MQEYLAQPMLIDGLKFDLRLYVLVADSHSSSEDESLVRFFLYREGLARFAVEAYEPPDDHNLANVHMHLTNYSLNKKAAGFKHCDDADGGNGSKRSVSSVFQQLERSGRIDSADALWAQIEALTARTLGVIYPVLSGSRGRWSNKCFQILGLDVLLDVYGQPWLIEINDHPSINTLHHGETSVSGMPPTQSAVDEAVKIPMLSDAMRVVSSLYGLGDGEGMPSGSGGWSALPTFRTRPRRCRARALPLPAPVAP